jgi:antitoxin FitA
MAAITVRNIPEETHRALKERAVQHGRSTEAEIRDIIEKAVRPDSRLKLGSAIVAMTRQFGGVDLDIERDQTPTEPVSFD